MVQIHINFLQSYFFTDFSHSLSTLFFLLTHIEILSKSTHRQAQVKACLYHAGEGWVIGCNWDSVCLYCLYSILLDVLFLLSLSKLHSPTYQVSLVQSQSTQSRKKKMVGMDKEWR